MSNTMIVKANQAVQNITESINDVSQGFTQARREFRDRDLHHSPAQGSIIDVGARAGAYVASAERYVVKYIVGRGYKDTDGLLQSKQLQIKQHGVVGFGLRTALNKLGNKCGIAPEINLAVRLADAVMAGARFVLISLPEAALFALGYGIAALAQLAYDGVQAGVDGAKRIGKAIEQQRAKRQGLALSLAMQKDLEAGTATMTAMPSFEDEFGATPAQTADQTQMFGDMDASDWGELAHSPS